MKILVVVDVQKDFVNGALGTPEAEAMIPNLQNLLTEMNSSDTLVLLTKDTHYENYLETPEGKNLPKPHCIKGTDGWKIDKRISSIVNSGLFAKYSSINNINSRICKETFGSLELANIIRGVVATFDVEEIIFTGLCTDICVVSNVLITKAAVPNTPITVRADCCAGVTPATHKAALDTMRMCQINIVGE